MRKKKERRKDEEKIYEHLSDFVFTTLAFVTLVDGERSFSFARKPGAEPGQVLIIPAKQ